MREYRGLYGDRISGGGKFVRKNGYGHEMFNFLPSYGYMYGFVRPNHETIRIERLGALKADDSIDEILAVWTAKANTGGTFIVGWYKNATVYKNYQTPPSHSKRIYKDKDFGYYVRAKVEDCKLLPVDKRTFNIPRSGNVRMGQSPVWFADRPKHQEFKETVSSYIDNYRIT